MTILFVTEISPIPPNGGEKLRSYGLLKIMSGLNFQVHAITGSTNSELKIEGIRSYAFDFKNLKSTHTYTRFFRICPHLAEQFITILKTFKIDVVFIDYAFYGQYINFFKKFEIPVIYGTHNAQAELFRQIPTYSLRTTLSKLWHYTVLRLHEFIFFRKADALIVVSEDDKKYHQSFVKKEKIYVIPNFLDEVQYKLKNYEKENYIIMSANFRAYQNLYGLEWFINNVWNEELWKKISLLLVGFNSVEALQELIKKYNCTNISAVGPVDDMKPYIAKARAAIVPLLHGSGTRLKCLESMALHTQLISTTKGAEGIEHENTIIVADTPIDFRNKLLEIIFNRVDLKENAYNVFLKKYSINPNKYIFKQIINNITSIKKVN